MQIDYFWVLIFAQSILCHLQFTPRTVRTCMDCLSISFTFKLHFELRQCFYCPERGYLTDVSASIYKGKIHPDMSNRHAHKNIFQIIYLCHTFRLRASKRIHILILQFIKYENTALISSVSHYWLLQGIYHSLTYVHLLSKFSTSICKNSNSWAQAIETRNHVSASSHLAFKTKVFPSRT